jgi:Trk-type K+ transport system membrane component
MAREAPSRQWLRRALTAVMIGVGLAALVSLCIEHGFDVPESDRYRIYIVDTLIVGLFALSSLILWFIAPDRKAYWRKHWLEIVLVGLLGLQAGGLILFTRFSEMGDAYLSSGAVRTLVKVCVLLLQVALVLQILVGLVRINERVAAMRARPAVVLVVSYVALILTGALLMQMPRSTVGSAGLPFIDAVFTSTSASCVTGLNVVDAGRTFTPAGQWILVALIQIGGLGPVTFAAFLSYLGQQRFSVGEALLLRDIFGYDIIGEMGRFLMYVVSITAVVELVGAAMIFSFLDEPGLSIEERFRWSIFHAVSAFNNAGFALKGNAMLDCAGAWGMTATMCGLVILGGLGFPVIMTLLRFRVSGLAWVRRRILGPARAQEVEPSGLGLQTKIALFMTLLLIAAGTLAIWMLEAPHALNGRSAGDQLNISLWHSVMTRTAGFNSIDIGVLQPTTLLVFILLMIVGASPVSTGGGVKTVAVAVIFAALRSMIRGRPRVEMFRRTIPDGSVNLAFSTAAIYIGLVILVSMTLSVTDPRIWGEKSHLAILFETVSALSTVGFSVGITDRFSDAGKLILCATMLIGRLGPLLLLLGLAGGSRPSHYRYPGEQVVVS